MSDLASNNSSTIDFNLKFGGEGGEGVISAGELFSQAAARTRYHVFTHITYPAEIKGGFSMIQIRVRDKEILSLRRDVDYLVVFNQMAYDRTINDLKEGGMLIYDPETVQFESTDRFLKYPVPLTKLVKEITGGVLGKNVVALGALGNLFKIDKKLLEELIIDKFQIKGQNVVDNNLKVLSAGYEAGEANNWERKFNLVSDPAEKPKYMMLSGNEAVALGAIAAGCRFVAGYPITPATSIFETLTQIMPLVGGTAIQLEDEIASISAIIGAAFGGEKVITPTSGPGLQLMGEQLNLAAMIEVPIVIVDVQRGGPSTGLPTKTEQSDLKFAIYGTAGESPRIIIAPITIEDCFYQTIRAFNLAERFQMPVLILTDQSLGFRKGTVNIPNLKNVVKVDAKKYENKFVIPSAEMIQIVDRVQPTKEELVEYKRFKITETGVSPISIPGTKDGQYLASGLEHSENGKADYTPQNHFQMSQKRFKKLEAVSKALEKNRPETEGDEDARIGILGWGSTYGAIKEARILAEEFGMKIKHLHPKIITPLPERQIRNFFSGLKHVIVVEENFTGQFAHFIKAKFNIKPIEFHKCTGEPVTPDEIFNGIKKVAQIADENTIMFL